MQLEFSTILSKETAVSHFFTTRKGGVSLDNYASLNLSFFCGDDPLAVTENKRILCDEIGINTNRLFVPREIHSNGIEMLDAGFPNLPEKEQAALLSTCDALITNIPDICLAVTTADCVPILLYDKKAKAIAAVHAGWKGIVKEILPLTIRKMTAGYFSDPVDIIVATGPCISQKYYQVNQDVVDEFLSVFDEKEMECILQTREDNTFYIDLRKAAAIQCQRENIPGENIEIHSGCTYQQHETYFSARRDSIHSGRMLSGIWLKGK